MKYTETTLISEYHVTCTFNNTVNFLSLGTMLMIKTLFEIFIIIYGCVNVYKLLRIFHYVEIQVVLKIKIMMFVLDNY